MTVCQSPVINDEDALETLLDPERTLADAIAYIKVKTGQEWRPKVLLANKALETLSVEILKKLSVKEIAPLQKLYASLQDRLADWEKLTGQKPAAAPKRKARTRVKRSR